LGGEARLFRQSIVEKYRELLGFQRMQGRARRLRPPVKATFRETFQAEPISLPIVNEQLERCAGDRVLIEARFAEGDERINPLAKVDGFVSEQDIELRYNLDHQCQKRRKSARSRLMKTRSRDGSVNVSLDPSGRSI
jgi:hypothetical protein